MHLLGKLSAFFLIPVAAAVALYFSARLFDTRSQYLTKYEALVKTRDENAAKLRDLTGSVDRLDKEIGLVQNAWGQQWVGANSTVQQGAEPMIDLGVGTTSGLGGAGKPAPTIYAFSVDANGGSKYLGDFDIIDPRADRTGAKLTHPPIPGETDGWQAGTIRVRDMVPSAHRGETYNLRTRQIVLDQQLENEKGLVALKDVELVESQKLLDRRLAELNGNPNAIQGASDDVKDGLVKTLEKEEGSRDALQVVVDKLRRELSDKYAALETVLAKNQEIVDQMDKERGVAGPGSRPAPQPVTTQLPGRTTR